MPGRPRPSAPDNPPAANPRPRRSTIKVVVTESSEAIDLDAWVEQYVRAAIAAYRAQQESENLQRDQGGD